jgi:type IV secretory pathway VirB4 component
MAAKNTPRPASTQSHVPIAQIRDSMVVMKDGTFRAVMVVSAINFALKSKQEQEAIIYQFQSFVNSLTSPIQIVVQSRQLDLNGYLLDLSNRAKDQTNQLLQFQMVDYIDFVSRLVTLANIMDKRFFVVVPHDTVNTGSKGLFRFVLGRKTIPSFTQQQFERYREELTERINVVVSGLGGLGLRAVQLNTQELIEFYYGLYNPEEAVEEKLADAKDLQANVIRKTPHES